MPKVSIIIPNYNHEKFLERRIDSVLNQSFQDWELIIMDDASTDNSRKIIDGYTQNFPQIKTVFNDQNSGGPFHQWNRGAQIAKGEYLWFAESDDNCEPILLEKLVPLLEQNPAVGIAYGQSYLVDEQDEIINSYLKNLKFIYKSSDWEMDFIKPGKAACRDWLLFHNPIPNASGAVLRKSVYMDCGMADPDMLLNGDWYLYSKMLCLSDLAFTAEHLNYFRVHPSTQRERSRSTARVYKEIIKINELIRREVSDADRNADEAIRKVSTWWEGNLYYQTWNRENRKLNRELYRYFSRYRSNLSFHIIYTFIIEITRDLMRRTGLLKPAKKVRSILFPGKYFEG
jgi:glycosyltransferase involved in cell wall biosynthesis